MKLFARFASLPPTLKLLLLLVFILTGVLFTAIIATILLVAMDVDVEAFTAGSLSTGMLKAMQLSTTLGMIGVPGLLAMIAYGYRDAVSKTKLTVMGAVLLLAFALLPVNEWLGVWNYGLDLPDFMQDLEDSIRLSEEQTAALVKRFLVMDGPLDLIINLIVVALAPAICEELLFRGALQRIFHERFDLHLAILAAAVVFSAFHMQFLGFVPRLVLGVVLGYLYAWSGKLIYPMLLHFINNATVVVLVYMMGPEMLETQEATLTASSPFVVLLLGVGISAAAMYYVHNVTLTPDESNPS